jgi:hypothetical protein
VVPFKGKAQNWASLFKAKNQRQFRIGPVFFQARISFPDESTAVITRRCAADSEAAYR